jgi:hypothetical protein
MPGLNGGKWITRSEALFAVFDQVGTADSLENSSQIQYTVKELLLECNENLVSFVFNGSNSIVSKSL